PATPAVPVSPCSSSRTPLSPRSAAQGPRPTRQRYLLSAPAERGVERPHGRWAGSAGVAPGAVRHSGETRSQRRTRASGPAGRSMVAATLYLAAACGIQSPVQSSTTFPGTRRPMTLQQHNLRPSRFFAALVGGIAALWFLLAGLSWLTNAPAARMLLALFTGGVLLAGFA